ncbi:MAG: hypothetical protein ABWX73_05415, partial [Marmoricola sp.]
MRARRWIVSVEQAIDAARFRRVAARPPAHFRIEPYGGHGTGSGVVVRGRVLDGPRLSQAAEGESVRTAVSRTLRGFLTNELPGVPLRVAVAGVEVHTVTDLEGYLLVHLDPGPLDGPCPPGIVELAG